MRPPIAHDRATTSAIVDHAVHALGRPDWAYEGTPYPAGLPLPRRVPLGHALRIADNVARNVADPYLHFRIARSGPLAPEPSLGLALQHAPTLADALRLAVDWCNEAAPMLEFELVHAGTALGCVVRPRFDLGPRARALVEAHVYLFYRCVESRRGLDLRGAAIEFAHAPAGLAIDYDEWLRCEPLFERERNAIIVPATWGDLPMPGADCGLWLLARERLTADVATMREPEYVDSIRRLVAASLAEGRPPRLKQVAAAQGVSTRTLIRTLRLAGTTFHELVDAERRARAAALILRPSLSLAQLARELGFPDSSSFGRRFRAWFGDSPGSFRRRVRLPRSRLGAMAPSAAMAGASPTPWR